jgi:hypothetical protein
MKKDPKETKPPKEASKVPEEQTPDTTFTFSTPSAPTGDINKLVIEIKDAVPMTTMAVIETEEPNELEASKEVEIPDKPKETEEIKEIEEPEALKESEILEKLDEPEMKEEKISSWDLEEEASPLNKNSKSFFKLGIIVSVIILVVIGIFLFFFLRSSSKKTPIEVKKVVEPTKAPKKAQINRSEWTLEILNGSGIPGLAAKATAKLTEQGYTVIKTGNADNQDYAKSELFIAENMQSKAQLLIDDLSSSYTFSSDPEVLKNSTVSARIIIGKD